MLNIDKSKFSIKLSTKYAFMEKSRWTEVLVHIYDDGVLELIVQCPNMQILHLYVERQSINPTVGYNEPDDSYIQHVSDGRRFNQAGTSTYDVFHEPLIYVPQVTEGLCNISLEHGSGSWDQHFTGGNEYFDTNTADNEIEVASPDQGDANTHVDNIDTEPDTSSDESDEEPADDEHEDIMHEGTIISSRPRRNFTTTSHAISLQHT
ncbi:ORESARA 9 family protein [Dorcoceras hygrometricum]|uniref:ORESARA 9 family protein n=1 Tax=Dorcoceras hygrometricum TaxID=472368 RepID=A0A2Z6ZTE9_9LAMI|nr:ORESARA 9 family protein [Dorcoceras hygrometricum]